MPDRARLIACALLPLSGGPPETFRISLCLASAGCDGAGSSDRPAATTFQGRVAFSPRIPLMDSRIRLMFRGICSRPSRVPGAVSQLDESTP